MHASAVCGSGILFADHSRWRKRTGRQLLRQLALLNAVEGREVQISAFGAPVVYAVLDVLYGPLPGALSHLGRDTGANPPRDESGYDPCNEQDQHAQQGASWDSVP